MVNNLSCLLKIDLNRYRAISPGADSDRIIVWSSTIKAHFGSKANQFTQKIRFFRYSSSVCLFNQNLSRKKKSSERKKIPLFMGNLFEPEFRQKIKAFQVIPPKSVCTRRCCSLCQNRAREWDRESKPIRFSPFSIIQRI